MPLQKIRTLYLFTYFKISFITNRKSVVCNIILYATIIDIKLFTCKFWSWKSPTDAVSPKSELSSRLSLDGQHMLSSLLLSWECWLNECWSAPYSEALESKRDKRPLLDGLSKTVCNDRRYNHYNIKTRLHCVVKLQYRDFSCSYPTCFWRATFFWWPAACFLPPSSCI